jgi:hypothetical protein
MFYVLQIVRFSILATRKIYPPRPEYRRKNDESLSQISNCYAIASILFVCIFDQIGFIWCRPGEQNWEAEEASYFECRIVNVNYASLLTVPVGTSMKNTIFFLLRYTRLRVEIQFVNCQYVRWYCYCTAREKRRWTYSHFWLFLHMIELDKDHSGWDTGDRFTKSQWRSTLCHLAATEIDLDKRYSCSLREPKKVYDTWKLYGALHLLACPLIEESGDPPADTILQNKLLLQIFEKMERKNMNSFYSPNHSCSRNSFLFTFILKPQERSTLAS